MEVVDDDISSKDCRFSATDFLLLKSSASEITLSATAAAAAVVIVFESVDVEDALDDAVVDALDDAVVVTNL